MVRRETYWTTITDSEGVVEQELSFDAWGNRRDPNTWIRLWSDPIYEEPMFDRGYTGHEHMMAFGLINMNGRCYDPVMSSFLSVDAFVQSPDNSQNFNRYSYCLNNPLKYTDPSGWVMVGGMTPSNPFHDNWGQNFGEKIYTSAEVRQMLWTMDISIGIWMVGNEMHGGGSTGEGSTPEIGGSPVYDEHGYFLGTDDGGLQGEAIVMRKEDFRQNMKHEEALALATNLDANDKDAEIRLYMNYSQLCNRPDWDGCLTLSEANEWFKQGSGDPLFVDLSKIDLSGIASFGKRQIGKKKTYNLLLFGNPFTDGVVYGNITLKYYPDHIVKAYSDPYDFDMKPWINPMNWGRNIETIIGHKVAGEGTPFNIYFYGTYQLTPILPWL